MTRDSRIGPISETVARTGWPSCPNTSQNITGNWSGWYASPMSLARFTNASLASPGAAIPDKSPLMSAAKTGTPAREKPSARTCNVTVLPVPVAPVIRPWRLPNLRSSTSYLWLLPTTIVWSAAVPGAAAFSSDAAAGAALLFRWAEGFRAMAVSEFLAVVLEMWRYSIAPRSFSHAGGPDPSSFLSKYSRTRSYPAFKKQPRRKLLSRDCVSARRRQ